MASLLRLIVVLPAITVVTLLSLLLAHHRCQAKWQSPCSKDRECNLPGEKCFNQDRDAMGCSKGHCGCPKGMGYNYNATKCLPRKQVALGEGCSIVGKFFSKTVGFETHIANAFCADASNPYAHTNAVTGVSMCELGYSQSRSICTYNLGKSCRQDNDCGSGGLGCVNTMCRCKSGFKLMPSTLLCALIEPGDQCETDDDCWPLGQMLERGSNSYSCSNKKCTCSTGFHLAKVNDIYFNETSEQMNSRSASYCFPKGSKFNLGAYSRCEVEFYSPASTHFAVCGPRYGCYLCPEDRENPKHTCRWAPSAGSFPQSANRTWLVVTSLLVLTNMLSNL